VRSLKRSTCWLASLLASVGLAHAQGAEGPSMAPIEQYRMPSPSDEMTLARSAAPAAISNDAQILTLGSRGYETAAGGKNGFVCIVERAWANEFDSAEFWNPKVRAPICFNAAAARSVLQGYLRRTEWALAGASKAEMLRRTKAAIAAKEITAPDVGAMCYMMSKDGYLNDVGGHWRPHLMFFLPHTEAAAWGANLPGVPVFGGGGDLEPVSVFMAPVPNWSDGTPGPMMKK
jgi:hypothetical protein